MLKKVIEYVMQNREVLQQVSAGNACLVGLTEIEQRAVVDVLQKPKRYAAGTLGVWN